MSVPADETRKALGVGVFYVLGGLLAIVGWPPIIPSVLLGSGIALMVYHFLGGVDDQDRMNLSFGQKAALQVGGASVILLASSSAIYYSLMEWHKDRLSSEPDLEDVLVLGRDGRPVSSLKIRRGDDFVASLSWPRPNSPSSLAAQELTLDLDPSSGRILVRPLGGSHASNFALGYLQDDYTSGEHRPVAAIVQRMLNRDFFNPTLVQLRSLICAGASCPVSAIGFPITVLASPKVVKGRIQVCYRKQDFAVGETFAAASASHNPSLLLQALAIAPDPDSPPSAFRSFPIARVDTLESHEHCRNVISRHAVIGLMHPADLRLFVGSLDRRPHTLFATNSAEQ